MTRNPRASISAADARLFAEELITGRGRLAQFAAKYPHLRTASQKTLAAICGETIPLFRHVTLREDAATGLREETAASTTLSPAYVLTLAADAPSAVTTRDAFVHLKPVLLRYDIDPSRVLVFVPVVAAYVVEDRGPALKRMRIECRGESYSALDAIMRVRGLGEQEVFANLSGLKPAVFEFTKRLDLARAREWLRGDIRTGRDAVREMKLDGHFFAEWHNGRLVPAGEEEEVARFDEMFAQLEEFFGDPCDIGDDFL